MPQQIAAAAGYTGAAMPSPVGWGGSGGAATPGNTGLTPANLDTGWRDTTFANWDHSKDSPLYSMPAAVYVDWYTSYDDGELIGFDNTTPAAPVIRRYIVPESGQLTPVGNELVINTTLMHALVTTMTTFSLINGLAVCRVSATRAVCVVQAWSGSATRPVFILLGKNGNGDWTAITGALPLGVYQGSYTSVYNRTYCGMSRVGPDTAIASLGDFSTGSTSGVANFFGITVNGDTLSVSSRSTGGGSVGFAAFPVGNGYSGISYLNSGTVNATTVYGVQHQGTGAPVVGSDYSLSAGVNSGVSFFARSGPLRPGVVVSLVSSQTATGNVVLQVGSLSSTYAPMTTRLIANTNEPAFGYTSSNQIKDGIFVRLNNNEGMLLYIIATGGAINSGGPMRALRITFDTNGNMTFHQNFEVAPTNAFLGSLRRAFAGGCVLNDGRVIMALNTGESSPGNVHYIVLKA